MHEHVLHSAHAQKQRQLATRLRAERASPYTTHHFTRILRAILQRSYMQIDILLVVAQQLFDHALRILHIKLRAIQHFAAVEDAVVQALCKQDVRVSTTRVYSTYWRHAGRAILHKMPTALLKCIEVEARPSTTVANQLRAQIDK